MPYAHASTEYEQDRTEMSSGMANTYKLWAILSSGLCFVLVGYIVASHVTAPAGEDQITNGAGLVDEFVVPVELRDLPREWISATLEDGPTGHSVMIELAPSGEFIAERCTHRGYFDQKRGAIRKQDWPFCEALLVGTLAEITPDRIVILSASGTRTELALNTAGTREEAPRLLLGLHATLLDLVPGSRNDLYQRMEARPAIQAEREAMLQDQTASRTNGG